MTNLIEESKKKKVPMPSFPQLQAAQQTKRHFPLGRPESVMFKPQTWSLILGHDNESQYWGSSTKYMWDMPEFRVFYRIETVSTYQYSLANHDSGSIQSQDWKALQASIKLVCLEFLGRQLQSQMGKNRIKSQSFSTQMMFYTSEHWELSENQDLT